MGILIRPDADQASLLAARIVARSVRQNPHAVLGFATGRTPLPLYRQLVRLHREDGLDFSAVTTFKLDEYDIAVTPSIEDLLAGRDVVMDRALRELEKR